MSDMETSRLLFRKFAPGDLNDLAAIRSDPDVMKYIGSGRPESIDEVQALLTKVITHCEQHGFGPWAVVEKATGTLAGWCGLKYLEDSGEVEIAYGLAKEDWGKGLASEAAAAAMQYGFERLDLDRIVAVTWPGNIASQRVLVKLHMKYVRNALFYNRDMAYYVISRREYQGGGHNLWGRDSASHFLTVLRVHAPGHVQSWPFNGAMHYCCGKTFKCTLPRGSISPVEQ